jgi:hypothetical protein
MPDSNQKYQPVDKLFKAYFAIKNDLDEHAKKNKEYSDAANKALESIKKEMQRICTELGTDSLKSKGVGTAFVTTQDFVSVSDWSDVLAFAIAPLFPGMSEVELVAKVEASNLHYIKKGVLKNSVKEYLDDHGGNLPPGTAYQVERFLQVREGN